jgi:hypothetical protein
MVLPTKAIVVPNAEPPVGVAYQSIPVPKALKLATVPLLHTDCDAEPVGACTVVIETTTGVRTADSQPLTVCEA